MAYSAQVIEVFIASSSDIVGERKLVRDVIAEWNAIYSRQQGIVLSPVGWETHSLPELGGRPQGMINDRLLADADILIGIFWTRMGTPTGLADSGTAEEIMKHHEAGKPTLLYFSSIAVLPGSIDTDQYSRLKSFKDWARSQGLIESFDNPDEFQKKLHAHLPTALHNNEYLQRLVKARGRDSMPATPLPVPSLLSEDDRAILRAMAEEKRGVLMVARFIGGTAIQVGARSFVNGSDHREIARWEAAVGALAEKGLIVDRGGKGEIFEITNAGYGALET